MQMSLSINFNLLYRIRGPVSPFSKELANFILEPKEASYIKKAVIGLSVKRQLSIPVHSKAVPLKNE